MANNTAKMKILVHSLFLFSFFFLFVSLELAFSHAVSFFVFCDSTTKITKSLGVHAQVCISVKKKSLGT